MGEPAIGNEESAKGAIQIERIYIKDLSFESPTSPQVFQEKWEPKIQLDINSRSRALAESHHEVMLTVTVKGTNADDGVLFIIEVLQAGIFKLTGLDENQLKRVLSTMCPAILFPYARETIDGLAVKGSLPPLALAPVNFDVLYENALAHAEQSDPATMN
ncbi:MAG: protein-export chaperone SecB [Pseudomonadales bacterium]|nr:protein-export chaperone SecB [Pseudomonadales bacterium]